MLETRQMADGKAGLLRRCAPRNDRIKVPRNDRIKDSRNDNNVEGEQRFAPTTRNDGVVALYERLDREIHGLLVDLGLMEQRTDEFVDQERLVKRFTEAWVNVVEKIEEKVVKQIEAGKTKVKV